MSRNIELPRRVGFTGTRGSLTVPQARELSIWLAAEGIGVLHHGDCVGADTEAHRWARALDWRIELHPASGVGKLRAHNSGAHFTHPERPPLMRNADIVRYADVMVACPATMQEELRSGTWATIRLARKAERELHILWPDGSVTWERGDAQGGFNAPQASTEAVLDGAPPQPLNNQEKAGDR